MKESLQCGLQYVFRFRVPPSKVVPALYPESSEFQAMPDVFATGFLVGLVEWACVLAVMPYLEPHEQTVGTHINISHESATPPGLEVTVTVELVHIEGRLLRFSVHAHDGLDTITRGTHDRIAVDKDRFLQNIRRKQQAVPDDSKLNDGHL